MLGNVQMGRKMTLAKKITLTLLGLIGLAVIAVGALVVSTAVNPTRPLGVQQILAPDPGHPPIRVTILYPTTAKPRWMWLGVAAMKFGPDGAIDGRKLPLVVMSHGTGGSPLSHIDTALALAQAGYVVAIPLHNGDNFQDDTNVGTSEWFVSRAREIARVDDYLLGEWKGRSQIDSDKVGFFGFSAGATTGLVTVGGTPNFALVGPHCATKPEFACTLLKAGTRLRAPAATEWAHDNRVKAAIIVAPGFGFTFEPDGLSDVKVPVQLWEGDADESLPLATNAGAVRRLLPSSPEFHLVHDAGHFSFMAPCGPMSLLLPKMLCADLPGFDRVAFHKDFNQAAVGFFDKSLNTR